jgi:MerR family transcriptional regulator, copper efflux regulator
MKRTTSLSLDRDCRNGGDPLTCKFEVAGAVAIGRPPIPLESYMPLSGPMRISELSKRTNLRAHTIRFYEKEGLLSARYVQRKTNNYRDYAEDAVNRLLLIKEGQLAGFSIAELRELTNGDESGCAADERQVILIERKLASIDRKIGRLEGFKAYLAKRLALVEQNSSR